MTIEITDYVEPIKANEYAPHVAALIEAGAGKALTVIVPLDDKLKARTRIAAAANDAGYTARIRVNEAHGTAEWRYQFTLTARNLPRRNKAREDEARAAASGHAFNGGGKECLECGHTARFHTIKAVTEDEAAASAPVVTPKPRNPRTRKA